MGVAAPVRINMRTEATMNPNSSSPARPDAPSPADRRDPAVQTGALPGGQPGQGVNTSSSPPGQSNVEAAAQQGTEYGKKDRDRR
jgi:hypothetical protein